jgi:predicted nucleotidyltransferase component of viral defense system
MNLHTDKKLFTDSIRAAAQRLNIKEEFIEKDYWITLVLNRLSKSNHEEETVFKGGTSLSKAYGLINRFSEDVDIALIHKKDRSGNEVKTIIRNFEKEMTGELKELQMEGVTSKGSQFRKSVHEYESIDAKNKNNKLIVEINSFANPFPYQKILIKSFIHNFLESTGKQEIIDKYDLQPFEINVLDKKQTLLEKLISLMRFSFDKNPVKSISNKIRHFYDLHFLIMDDECAAFIKTPEFKKQFMTVMGHDRAIFDDPEGWKTKNIEESPLIKDFDSIWSGLKSKYNSELSALAFTAIPRENEVATSIKALLTQIS